MAFPRIAAVAVVLLVFTAVAGAQTTSGSISGLVTDSVGNPLIDIVVVARNPETGTVREMRTDRAGSYRLAGLPVGQYALTAETPGLRSFTASVVVRVGRDVTLDIMLLPAVNETITVSTTPSLIPTQSSAVGEIVDLSRIAGLPLNGRQFANLAATVAGVGLGFHSDSTKTAQYTPQISGGNGRNVNYVVDGGDNNDDTVGGLLQLFPLEAIQEFAVVTQRFDAEYGRSNGAVLNVVTKSGTNERHGSWFTLMRDDAMNARTFSEHLASVDKQDYQRYQFGGSLGGPLVLSRAHYFGAYERTHQDTKQVVDTGGVFPAGEGIFNVPFRQDLFTGKVTTTFPGQYLSIRYGRDHNTEPTGAGRLFAHSAWATSANRFDSVNVNHNWIARSSLLNEAVIQYSNFANDTTASTTGPAIQLLNGVRGGSSPLAPQSTQQVKWQFRNDLSWTTTSGPGVSHQFRSGVNWVHEPRLRVHTSTITQGLYVMQQNTVTGPITDVTVANAPTVNFPLEQYGVYIQDDWRVSHRITLNLGLRWDYVDGFPIDQSGSANFQALQEAGAAGLFAGTLLDEFGREPRPDRDNVQPRVGAAIDLLGDGRHVVRGGWGLYTDFGYIASNVLTAGFDAVDGGIVFVASNPNGLRKEDGSFFRVGDPLSSISSLNLVTGGAAPAGEVVSPLLEQPYSRQAHVGYSHQLGTSTVVSADYVRVDGRDLNLRLRPNVRISSTRRLLTGVDISPNSNRFRTALSKGSSRYDGLILSFRHRLSHGVDASASYTLAEATSDVGTAYDEIVQTLIQDIRDPFGPVQQAPSARTDSRHLISISAIVEAPWGVAVAPVFFYRSALPVHTFEGIDLNNDSINNDRTAASYRYTGLAADGHATFEDSGPCGTVNCSRRAGFSQLNLRISRAFTLLRSVRIEAIGEVFNLFNAKNPSLALMQPRLAVDPVLGLVPNSGFMQPTAFAGDVGQSEQRVGQIGFRITF